MVEVLKTRPFHQSVDYPLVCVASVMVLGPLGLVVQFRVGPAE